MGVSVVPGKLHRLGCIRLGTVRPRLSWRRILKSTLVSAGVGLVAITGACGDPGVDPNISALVTVSEFLVGENRFPVRIVTNDGGTFPNAVVHVRFFTLEGERSTFQFEADATYREVPVATHHTHADGTVHDHGAARRFFTVDAVRFDRPGIWLAEFTVRPTSHRSFRVETAFMVQTGSTAPLSGELVPAVSNPTRHDVVDLREITSVANPIEGMYDLTVEEAVAAQEPFVVVFSTPLFCGTRMCGPVMEVVAKLYPRYVGRVNFIHIEPFDLSIARSEGRLVPVPAVEQWGLRTEPWVFVVNPDGRVASRIEGLVAAEELALAIDSLLAP